MIRAAIDKSSSMFSSINRITSRNNRMFQNGMNIFHRAYSNIVVRNWIETLSEAQKEKVVYIQNEIELYSLEHKRVPQLEKLNVEDYSEMLGMSNNKRHKYYNYLHSQHWTSTAQDTKKKIRLQLTEAYAPKKASPNGDLDARYREYGLGKNFYLPMIRNKTIDAMKNRKVSRQILVNGSKIVFDLGFANQMTPRENSEVAKQLTRIIGDNRSHRLPYVMHFCNAYDGNPISRLFHKMVPNLPKQPLFMHEEDYLDVLPKEKIVLLTPDSPNTLEKYNPEDHYVIGAIVDRGDKKPLTLSKAKKFDIRTARLPLENYRSVRRNLILNLNEIFNVMLDVRMYRNWDRAFNHIAPRKLK